jgi:hypothetical protein
MLSRLFDSRLFRRAPSDLDQVGPRGRAWAADPSIDAALRTAWIEDGLVVLRGVYDAAAVARFDDCVGAVRGGVAALRGQRYTDRIGQLHQQYPALLELAAAPDVVRFLRWALEDDPLVFGSLSFERGSQQGAHVDAIFFYTEPIYAMAGVWIALEDVDPDAGPLFYLPGSHRWPFPHADALVAAQSELAARWQAARDGRLEGDERAQFINGLGQAWVATLERTQAARQAAPVALPLKRGDVAVWHALLAHGGTPQHDPARTRKSVVFHYIGATARLFSMHEFFLHSRAELLRQTGAANPRGRYGTLEYIRYPTFATYDEGREILHPVT